MFLTCFKCWLIFNFQLITERFFEHLERISRQFLVCGTIDPGFELHQCLLVGNMEKNCSAAMLAAKRLAGVTPEVNLMETLTHTPPPSVNKTTHSGFETQRRHNQKLMGYCEEILTAA